MQRGSKTYLAALVTVERLLVTPNRGAILRGVLRFTGDINGDIRSIQTEIRRRWRQPVSLSTIRVVTRCIPDLLRYLNAHPEIDCDSVSTGSAQRVYDAVPWRSRNPLGDYSLIGDIPYEKLRNMMWAICEGRKQYQSAEWTKVLKCIDPVLSDAWRQIPYSPAAVAGLHDWLIEQGLSVEAEEIQSFMKGEPCISSPV